MKSMLSLPLRWFQTGLAFWIALNACLAVSAADPLPKTRLLIIVGGHDFQTNQFYQVFNDIPDVTYQAAEHPKAHALLKTDAAKQYDVIVLYDMWQNITDEAKADFISRLQEGKGLVALHHCLGSYQKWPEYSQIIGGKYHLQKRVENGIELAGSTYLHDVDFKVHVADPNHPVTRGLNDFEIHDETYGNLELRPGTQPLLTANHPTSSPTVAWAKTYGPARVVTIQLGHDGKAYENPNFRRLVAQAIRWTAKSNETSRQPAPGIRND